MKRAQGDQLGCRREGSRRRPPPHLGSVWVLGGREDAAHQRVVDPVLIHIQLAQGGGSIQGEEQGTVRGFQASDV